LDLVHAGRIPGPGNIAAVGIQKTHERGAGVARGVEGIPDLAGAVAADLLAGRVLTYGQDVGDTVIVPFDFAAVGIALTSGRSAVTDVVDAGITWEADTVEIEVVSHFADVMLTRWLRLGRGGPRQPAQTHRNQQPVEAGKRTPSFGSRAG
jgi:hypothetical protein